MSIEIVLDLETMGKSNDAAIIEIGAVAFDNDTLKLIPANNGGTFSAIIKLESAMKSGGVVDGDTIMWWMKQSEEARSRFSSGAAVGHVTALYQFANWLRELCAARNGLIVGGIWGNGAVFDNVKLASAYQRADVPVPWTYKQDRCYRTLRAVFPHVKPPRWRGVYHSGVDDARNEALHLIKILKGTRA